MELRGGMGGERGVEGGQWPVPRGWQYVQRSTAAPRVLQGMGQARPQAGGRAGVCPALPVVVSSSSCGELPHRSGACACEGCPPRPRACRAGGRGPGALPSRAGTDLLRAV